MLKLNCKLLVKQIAYQICTQVHNKIGLIVLSSSQYFIIDIKSEVLDKQTVCAYFESTTYKNYDKASIYWLNRNVQAEN